MIKKILDVIKRILCVGVDIIGSIIMFVISGIKKFFGMVFGILK